VARGLAVLHANKVIHLDLKAPNVLIDEKGTARIGDVALAANLQNATVSGGTSSSVGMWAYSAPEIVNAGGNTLWVCVLRL
jgi:serine/threonine protein kinase